MCAIELEVNQPIAGGITSHLKSSDYCEWLLDMFFSGPNDKIKL